MMTDESPREARPVLAPLQREVEAPRTATGLWLPFMALASAAMLTIVSGIAVMTRPARQVLVAPAEAPPMVEPTSPTAAEQQNAERVLRDAEDAHERQEALLREHNIIEARVLCGDAVYRGDLDGRPQPFEECIQYRRKGE